MSEEAAKCKDVCFEIGSFAFGSDLKSITSTCLYCLRRRHRHQTPDIRLHTAYASAKPTDSLKSPTDAAVLIVYYDVRNRVRVIVVRHNVVN